MTLLHSGSQSSATAPALLYHLHPCRRHVHQKYAPVARLVRLVLAALV